MHRVAVLGCGMIGAAPVKDPLGVQSHAAAWARRPDVRLVALADADPSRLATARAEWGVELGFTDPAELLARTAPEIVSVCTPDETHGRLLRAVLSTPSVRAVLAEKPLTLDPGEGLELVRLAERRGVLLAVNYGRRSLPSHRRLKAWLDTAPIGPIEAVRGAYVRGLKHNGTHWLDLARFLVGPIASIHGVGRTGPGETDATIDVTLRFENGARGELLGVKHAHYALFEMELIGAAGRVRLVDGGRRFELQRAAPSAVFDGFRELARADGPEGGIDDLVLHAVADLMDAFLTGRPPACTGRDALAALCLADVALAGTRIPTPERISRVPASR